MATSSTYTAPCHNSVLSPFQIAPKGQCGPTTRHDRTPHHLQFTHTADTQADLIAPSHPHTHNTDFTGIRLGISRIAYSSVAYTRRRYMMHCESLPFTHLCPLLHSSLEWRYHITSPGPSPLEPLFCRLQDDPPSTNTRHPYLLALVNTDLSIPSSTLG
jgi:hypothetical protein